MGRLGSGELLHELPHVLHGRAASELGRSQDEQSEGGQEDLDQDSFADHARQTADDQSDRSGKQVQRHADGIDHVVDDIALDLSDDLRATDPTLSRGHGRAPFVAHL